MRIGRIKKRLLRWLLDDEELWMAQHAHGSFAKNAKRLHDFMYKPSTIHKDGSFHIDDPAVVAAMSWNYGGKRVAFSVEDDPDSLIKNIYNGENPVLKRLTRG